MSELFMSVAPEAARDDRISVLQGGNKIQSWRRIAK